jgi:hypothetical protein
MNRFMNFSKGLLTIVVLSSLFMACKDDEVTPTTARIHGVITIDNVEVWDTWKDSGEVQLTIFPEFTLNPPAGWGEVPDDLLGPGVPGGTFAIGAPYNSQNPLVLDYSTGANQFAYEIILDPGTYSALALGFRHDLVMDASRRTATLGVHWGNENTVSHGIVIRVDIGGGMIIPIFDFPAPSEIVLEAGDEVEINFKADFGFVEDWF